MSNQQSEPPERLLIEQLIDDLEKQLKDNGRVVLTKGESMYILQLLHARVHPLQQIEKETQKRPENPNPPPPGPKTVGSLGG